MGLSYPDFVKLMISAAKEIQGDNYAGDDYYNQDCWMDYWEDGDTPADTVLSDMDHWS